MKASLSFAILIAIIITIIVVPTILLAHGQEQEDDELPILQVLNGVDGVQEIPLKAIQTNGNIEAQEDYSIDPSNVITVEKDKNIVLMNDQGIISKVNAIDSKLESTDLYFADNLVKADLPSGSYILSVIVTTDDGVEYGFVTIMVVLAPTQTLSEVNIQNIINAFTSKNIETNIIFEDGDDDNEPPEEEEAPSVCFFFPNENPHCKPVNGECPEDAPVMNEQGNCHGGGKCPTVDGVPHERVDDDESGKCYPTTETHHCEGSGAIVLDPDDCAIYETPIAEASNDTSESITCEPGFKLENGRCAELNSFCGTDAMTQAGIPNCTASEKEDSTTSDPVSPEPEPPTTESEEVVEEIEDNEADNNNNDDNNGGSNNDNDSDNDSEEDNDDDGNEDEDNGDEEDEGEEN